MNFSENLLYLRRRASMSQEELAEKLSVSRQTVSKWESGGAFPEMEKLLNLCELFGVSMDTLLRRSAEESLAQDSQDYDRHMTAFARGIAGGVTLILLGVTALVALNAFFSERGAGVGTVLLLAAVIAAVTLFIVCGMQHEQYVKENPAICWRYPEEELRRFRRRYPAMIAVPVAVILLGVLLAAAAFTVLGFPEQEPYESLVGAVLLLCVALGSGALVYAGMLESKYNIDKYNLLHDPEDTSVEAQRFRRGDRWGGVIMLGATALFLALGFGWNLWHPGWAVFPVGGILVAIVDTVSQRR
ncbi:MAG: helix-turn-helix domain-containing protein [Oscillospiraceae bacterium]